MALLWIIGCCGIIADAGLDNGHSLSFSVSISLPLALSPLRKRGRGKAEEVKEERD